MPAVVHKCMLDDDVISLILAQLPMAKWDAMASISTVWARAVLSKARETSHVKLIGFLPSASSFTWPTCAAPRKGGGLMVSEAWSHQIVCYDPAGRKCGSIGSVGRQPGQLIYPTALAVGPNGNIFVVDSGNHRIQVFDAGTCAPLQQVGSAGEGDGQFGSPKAIAYDCGKVIVSDGGQHRLSVFSAETLVFERHIGRKGNGAGELNTPEGLAIWHGKEGEGDNGSESSHEHHRTQLYVADSENHRVQVFDLVSGRHLRIIGDGQGRRPGQFEQPSGVAIDLFSRLIVSECKGRRLQVLSLQGEPLQIVPLVNSTLKSVCCPQDGDDAKQGKVYVCDFANHRIGLLQLLPQRI